MDKYQITFETWDKVASLYQEKFMDLALYNDSYNLFCDAITTREAQILEIGCGPGNITQYLLERRSDFHIKAIDVASNMLRLAKINNPTAHFEQMDCRNIHRLEGLFDGIIAGFCIPYLAKEDTEEFIQNSFQLLNKNGLFYFSFIEGDYATSGYEVGSSGDKAFVYYYQKFFFRQQLKQEGFEVLKSLDISYPKGDNKTQIHSIFIAIKR